MKPRELQGGEEVKYPTVDKVYALCNEYQWFTCGSNNQYDKLFVMIEEKAPIEEVATVIWLCSDDKWCRRDILAELKEAAKKASTNEC